MPKKLFAYGSNVMVKGHEHRGPGCVVGFVVRWPVDSPTVIGDESDLDYAEYDGVVKPEQVLPEGDLDKCLEARLVTRAELEEVEMKFALYKAEVAAKMAIVKGVATTAMQKGESTDKG